MLSVGNINCSEAPVTPAYYVSTAYMLPYINERMDAVESRSVEVKGAGGTRETTMSDMPRGRKMNTLKAFRKMLVELVKEAWWYGRQGWSLGS